MANKMLKCLKQKKLPTKYRADLLNRWQELAFSPKVASLEPRDREGWWSNRYRKSKSQQHLQKNLPLKLNSNKRKFSRMTSPGLIFRKMVRVLVLQHWRGQQEDPVWTAEAVRSEARVQIGRGSSKYHSRDRKKRKKHLKTKKQYLNRKVLRYHNKMKSYSPISCPNPQRCLSRKKKPQKPH